jgi:CBS domain-containing protein
MATIQTILDRKPGGLLVAAPTMSVLDAAKLMNEHGTGSVLVCDGDKLLGIFTERDLMRRVVAVQKDLLTTRLMDVMTTSLVTAHADATTTDCGTLMSERRIRHLPVVEGDKVLGVITTGDLLANELADKEATIQQLESFVFYVRQ